MAYDAQSDRMIVFAGDRITGLNETWAFDYDTNTWTNVSGAAGPSGRIGSAMAYDESADQVVLFGGFPYQVPYAGPSLSNETWAYDLETTTWTEMGRSYAPSWRMTHAMAFDSQSDRIVLFGGASLSGPPSLACCFSSDETWVYDFKNDNWTEMREAIRPPSRWAHAMAYDSQSDRVILFGGQYWDAENVRYVTLADTWAYDFDTNRWRNMTPANGPSPRLEHAMAYDSQSDRVILFGGLDLDPATGSAITTNDTWAYDFETNTWTDMRPAFAPYPRAGHAMAYDSQSDRVILVGGTEFEETWAYDFETNTWTRLPREFPPTLGSIGVSAAIVVPGEAVTMTAAAYDPDGDILTFAWNFGDGLTETGKTAQGKATISATHSFTAVGTYTVSLTIDDGDGGLASTSTSVKVVELTLLAATETKLTPSDGAAGDTFGYSVAIDGDTIVVGAFDGDGAATDAGSAYVFARSGETWTEQGKLIASDGTAEDWFGFSVAIDRDTIVVGAPSGDGLGTGTNNAAYVFVRSGTTWMEQAKLTARDGRAGNAFGYSVAISGDTVFVGAPWARGYPGVVYVFARSGTTWTDQGKLTARDGTADDWFGFDIALSGETAVVGAPSADGEGNDAGAAYVFVQSGTTWMEQGKLIASDGAYLENFGFSVAIDQDAVLVGAPWEGYPRGPGAAYVFVRYGTTWTEQGKLLATDGAAFDNFGHSVGISGDNAVVGARFDDFPAADSGSAYVFARNGATWMEQGKLIASDEAADSWLGMSVAVSGSLVVVGANGPAPAGAAYVFELQATNRPPTASFTAAPSAPLTRQTVTFDASGSSDPDGTVSSFTWDFGDGSTASGVTVEHAYVKAGTYSVTLTVNDGGGLTDTATQSIVVAPDLVAPSGMLIGAAAIAIVCVAVAASILVSRKRK